MVALTYMNTGKNTMEQIRKNLCPPLTATEYQKRNVKVSFSILNVFFTFRDVWLAHKSVIHVCVVPMAPRRGRWISWNWGYRPL